MDQVLAHVLALFVVLIPNFFFDPYSGSTNTHVRMHALARVSLLLRHHMTEADTCSRCRSKLRLRSTRVRLVFEHALWRGATPMGLCSLRSLKVLVRGLEVTLVVIP